jgi:hypothetical protein
MLGQRQRTVINLVIPWFFLFFLILDRNHIITNPILLESRSVKNIKKACFNMEMKLPKNPHALSYEVRVMNV